MKRKFILLQAIENGFLTHADNYSSLGVDYVTLLNAKEKVAADYFIEGNTEILGTPSIDAPAAFAATGYGENNYFELTVSDEYGHETNKNFLLPRPLYKVGNIADKIDYLAQTAYYYVSIFNLLDILDINIMDIFRKDADVVYVSIPYDGRNDSPCLSLIWPFNENNANFNLENMGIYNSNENLLLYFGLSWDRLGLAYENNTVYYKTDLEKTPLSNEAVLEICVNYISTLSRKNLKMLGTKITPDSIKINLPSLHLFKGQNTVNLSMGAETIGFITENKDKITTENDDYLTLEGTQEGPTFLVDSTGKYLTTRDGEKLIIGTDVEVVETILPYKISIDYKTFIKAS